MRSKDANNQAEQKIKLEKEMQILEKCMEDMKAVYRLNEEKLDFNTKKNTSMTEFIFWGADVLQRSCLALASSGPLRMAVPVEK